MLAVVVRPFSLYCREMCAVRRSQPSWLREHEWRTAAAANVPRPREGASAFISLQRPSTIHVLGAVLEFDVEQPSRCRPDLAKYSVSNSRFQRMPCRLHDVRRVHPEEFPQRRPRIAAAEAVGTEGQVTPAFRQKGPH